MSLRKILPLLLFFSVSLAGCSVSPIPAVLDPASSIAREKANLFNLLFWIGIGVFLLVVTLLFTAIIRNRQRDGDTTEPAQIYGNHRLEVIWTAIPIMLVIFIFIMTIRTMNAVAAPPSADLTVKVIGHRWWWEFEYPGFKTANELHIPVDTDVLLDVTSVDVIHSFWPPQLSGKMDVVPGVVNKTWIRSEETGVFSGYCAEFCGEQHANMRFLVVVQSREDFDAWLANQTTPNAAPTAALEQEGEKIVAAGMCAGCHTIDGTNARGMTGPNLTKLYSRTTLAGGVLPLNDRNIEKWLAASSEIKPNNLMAGIKVTPDQMEAVIAYLKTLK